MKIFIHGLHKTPYKFLTNSVNVSQTKAERFMNSI